MVYLDNAATSFPKPESVYRAVDSFLRSSGNPGRGGHALARLAEEAVEAVRLRVARFFHLPSPERVIFTLNATDALNMAIKGYLRPGDHDITTSLEHNSVARPLQSLSERGVRVTRVTCDQQGLLDLEALDKAITPTTRLVVLTWASNVVGTLQPVPEVARICRRHGVKLLVDAAQAAGHIPIDVQAVGVDMLAASGHKGLMGPPGTGLLLLAPDVDLAPCREGGTGVASHLATQPHFYPQRLESGTPNTAGIVGLGAGLQFLTQVGVDRVAEHEAQLTEALWEGLASVPSVALYGPPGSRGRAALLSFNVEGWDPVEVATVLDQSFGIACRAGLHCAPWAHQALGTFPTGTVRFSVGYFNTMQDVEQAVHAVKAIVASGRR
ncbi:MAG: cysteine desulfurase [Bacillota bacterium]|nr:cysteine desulfurase [Bacillota bacterium]